MLRKPSVSPRSQAAQGRSALALAADRFSNLCREGILPKKRVGEAMDPADVSLAASFLAQCRPTKTPSVHSADLRRVISRWSGRDVSAGSVIAAAVASGFDVAGWYGIMEFYPNALIGVNSRDCAKLISSTMR